MGCHHSKHTADVAVDTQSPVMRPSTPSFQPRESRTARASAGTSGNAPQGEELEEDLPSFVLSTTSDLIKSSDSEAVEGMVSAFTFSFIQVSEASMSSSSGLDSSSSASASDDDRQAELDGDAGESATDQMPPIPEEGTDHKDEQDETTTGRGGRKHANEGTQASLEASSNSRAVAPPFATDDSASSGASTVVCARDHAVRLSEATNDSDDVKEYLVTESGDVRVALDVALEEDADAEANQSANSVTKEGPTAAIVAAIVDEVIESAIKKTAMVTAQPGEDLGKVECDLFTGKSSAGRDLLSREYSTMTNPSSTERNIQSLSTFEVIDESNSGDASLWTYVVVGTSVSPDGVVYYHIQLTDGTTNKWPVPALKRYSEFKELRSTLKASDIEVTADFPPLPRAGLTQLVRGKLSKRTIAQREQQFTAILRFIAQHRGLKESAAFRSFVAQ